MTAYKQFVVVLDHRAVAYVRRIVKASLKYNFEVQVAMAKLLFSKKKYKAIK